MAYQETQLPHILAAETYGLVSTRMLTEQEQDQSALLDGPGIQAFRGSDLLTRDSSFTAQIRDLIHRHIEIDAYVVTAMSGIAVAATIRGFHAALTLPEPYITYIDTTEKPMHHLFSKVGSPFRPEARRTRGLAERLDGYETVCIVEQFVLNGYGLKYAQVALEAIGKQTHAICGTWYIDDPYKDQIDLNSLETAHTAFMYQVGRDAAQHI
jgi:hypothetical protein